ncbi:hypothetical protein V6Z12_D04G028700 [Gossypium hirsutum]
MLDVSSEVRLLRVSRVSLKFSKASSCFCFKLAIATSCSTAIQLTMALCSSVVLLNLAPKASLLSLSTITSLDNHHFSLVQPLISQRALRFAYRALHFHLSSSSIAHECSQNLLRALFD